MENTNKYFEILDVVYPDNFNKAKKTYLDAIESTQNDIDKTENLAAIDELEEELGDYQAGLVFIQHQEFFYEQQPFHAYAKEKLQEAIAEGKFNAEDVERLCSIMITDEYKQFTTLTLDLVESYSKMINANAKESYAASYGRKN